jgi:iron uptake system component EfeO
MNPRLVPVAIGATALALVLVSCVPNNPVTTTDGASTTLTVHSSANACTVSATEAPSGSLVFEVTNSGDEVTEFYLLADDGLRIVGEVEDVGPGVTRNLVVDLEPGSYFTACKPGMVGAGVGKAPFTVTAS